VADYEQLAEEWPIHGTTGYRFVNVLTGVFIDKSAEANFDRVYQRFTGERASFHDLSITSRHLIMNTTLAAELLMLSRWLARIAGGNRFTRDFTASGLSKALAEIAAHFPVYRSYVSARLAVLSELSSTWRLWLRRWSTINRSHRTGEMPSRADEYHFYQALIAVWPADAERLKAYMLKSAREAKLHTSWINPDAEYEAALERFVTESMASVLFRKELDEAMPRLVHLGLLGSLSQALVKVASPGVPDYYQGTELWDFSLVDPDNRRPVEFGSRTRFLAELEKRPPKAAELL